jgi:methylmalonyl-CoA mutase
LAIQLIINRELGLTKNENPLQGSFFLEDLTGLVEQAVLAEFEALDSRGGVLGSMERQYQRTKIQEESLYYERMKESGEYPVVGVNTFLSKEGSPFIEPTELVRSTPEDRDRLITDLDRFHQHHADRAPSALIALRYVAASSANVFDQLMETSKVASLQQMTEALFAVGGRYRRNM